MRRPTLIAALVVLGITLSLPGAPARAQNVPAVARELARLAFTSPTFDGSLALAADLGTQMVRADVEKRVHRRLTDREVQQLEDLFARTMKTVIPQHEWEGLFAAELSRQFSVDDMQALVAFYQTPLGAKVRRLSEILVKEGAAVAHRLITAKHQEFQRRFGAAFDQEFAGLALEIRQSRRVPSPPATTF